MKKALLLLGVLLAIGCDNGSSHHGSPLDPPVVLPITLDVPSDSTPVIDNLYCDCDFTRNAADGPTYSFKYYVRVEYADMEGDIDKMTVSINSKENIAPALILDQTPTNGHAYYQFGVVLDVLTTTTFPFQVWLVDDMGNESNKLDGNLNVTITAP